MWDTEFDNYFNKKSDVSYKKSQLHYLSHLFYNKLDIIFQIQIIILSSINAMLVFIGSKYNITILFTLSPILGIYVSIITSITKYFKISQLTEQHLNAYKAWDRLYEKIHSELELNKDNRMEPKELKEYVEQKYTRSLDLSPNIPERILINNKHLSLINNNDINNNEIITIPYGTNNEIN